jgi:predicted Zn-dependent protease
LVAGALVLFSAIALLIQLPPWQSNLAFYYYGHRMAPKNPHPFWGLAEVYLMKGDLPHAEQVLTDLVVQFPAPKAFEQLADIRMRMGQPASAEDPLRRAIQAAPERLNLHGELAECLQAQGKTQEAQIEAQREAALRAAQSR